MVSDSQHVDALLLCERWRRHAERCHEMLRAERIWARGIHLFWISAIALIVPILRETAPHPLYMMGTGLLMLCGGFYFLQSFRIGLAAIAGIEMGGE